MKAIAALSLCARLWAYASAPKVAARHDKRSCSRRPLALAAPTLGAHESSLDLYSLAHHCPGAGAKGRVVRSTPATIDPESVAWQIQRLNFRPNLEAKTRSRHQTMVGKASREVGLKGKSRFSTSSRPSSAVVEQVMQSAGLFLTPGTMTIMLENVGKPSSVPKPSTGPPAAALHAARPACVPLLL
eukprot:3005199-Amphidinium_carterae.1